MNTNISQSHYEQAYGLQAYESHYSYLCSNSDVYTFFCFIQIGKASVGTVDKFHMLHFRKYLHLLLKYTATNMTEI